MELIIATKNKGKLKEIHELLQDLKIKITSLEDYSFIPEIIEDGNTFEENAYKKAKTVLIATGKWVLADDSGLVVKSLNGEPGINSARYSGKHADYKANNQKLLKEMANIEDNNREAYFICSMILLAPDGKKWNIEGRCYGKIIRKEQGNKGFGYDPIFYLPEKKATMAELSMQEKNQISHRGKALKELKKVLIVLLA